MFETWNLLEVIWTIVALTGVVYSSLNIKNGIADLLVPALGYEKEAHIIAWGNIRRDFLRWIIQVMYVALGLWSGLGPEPDRTPRQIIGLILFSSILTFTSLLLTISARYDHRDRINLLILRLKRQKP